MTDIRLTFYGGPARDSRPESARESVLGAENLDDGKEAFQTQRLQAYLPMIQ